jgi:hypothetical protein
MKIQDPNLSGINLTTGGTQQANRVQSAERVNGKLGTGAIGADAVQLSGIGREVEALLNDPARAEFIQSLQLSVADGSYQPNSQTISNALIEDAFAN